MSGIAFPSGSKASGIDELPYALELEPLNREDVSGKLKMRSLSGNNPPWKIITRYPIKCSAPLLCFPVCKTPLPWLLWRHVQDARRGHLADHVSCGVCRKYLIDYIALLLMVIVLVISEEAVPFTRYIYHANDQACLLLPDLHSSDTYTGPCLRGAKAVS